MSEPGGVVVQPEGGDPEPVDVMRRDRDVVLGESISAETGVNQRPAPPTPRVTIGRRFTVFPEQLTGIVLYFGLERKNSDGARHPQYRSTTKHMTWEVRHDTGVSSLVEYRRSRRHLGFSRARPLSGFVLVWAGFIGWGCFFHSGANNNALVKTIVGNAYGALVAWVALLIIVNVPVPGLGAVWPAIVVGVTVFFLVIVASVDLLSVVPANVYGYAALVAYSLHQPSAAPATGPLQNLVSPSFANPLVLLIVSMVIGALFGYASDQLAKVLPTRQPTRASV